MFNQVALQDAFVCVSINTHPNEHACQDACHDTVCGVNLRAKAFRFKLWNFETTTSTNNLRDLAPGHADKSEEQQSEYEVASTERQRLKLASPGHLKISSKSLISLGSWQWYNL